VIQRSAISVMGAAAARWGAVAGVPVVGVEPDVAACLTAALEAGSPVEIPTPGTTMAGLDCAVVSQAAWPSLRTGIHSTITVSDDEVHAAMRSLSGRGLAIGDSGAAPYAAVGAVPDRGRVLLIATEGPTDPDGYRRVLA
jgi:diaminopropionate ammonia-lyase